MEYSHIYTNTPGGRLGKDPGEGILLEDLGLGPGSLVGPVIEVEHSEEFVTLIVEHVSTVIYLSINAWSAKRGQMLLRERLGEGMDPMIDLTDEGGGEE